MIYKKWRDLDIDLNNAKFKNVEIEKIISYPPAGNDVIEVILKNGENAFIKFERSKMADFKSEIKNINILFRNKYYTKIPYIYEYGIIENKNYIVLSKIEGKRLSEIIKDVKDKNKYLFKYGKELAIIHKIPTNDFSLAKQRIINDIPSIENYKNFDSKINKYIKYLEENNISKEYNTFIHGDFHYANILWKYGNISGIIDFEYSGLGFKEQDIAWSIVLRPYQKFMDNIDDIKTFLEGYKTINEYDENKLKWCLINAYCHFYLMNKDEEYKNRLLKLLDIINNYFQ